VNRALPAVMVDLIRDGVSPIELRAKDGGDRAVWKALVRTAASASQRGQSEQEWAALVTDPASALGGQSKLKHGRKARGAADHAKTLRAAWQTAQKWVTNAPTPIDRDDALHRARAVRDWAADPAVPLDDAERAVLAYAAAFAAQKGTDRPALPRRALMDALGLPERAVRGALGRLHDAGLLTLEVRGKSCDPQRPNARRRANLYRLPGAAAMNTYLYRGTRSVGQPAQVYGAPESKAVGAATQVYGAEQSDNEEGTPMVTFTLSAASPEALARALVLLRREEDVQVTVADKVRPEEQTNVVQIRPERREAS